MKRPLRVLYVIDAMTYKGTQTHIANMMRGHDTSAFEPYLLCIQEKGPLGEQLESDGYHVMAYGLKRIYGVQAMCSYPGLIGFLRRNRIDIFHAYLFAAQVYGIPAARCAGVPLVIAGRRALGIHWRAAKYVMARRVSNFLSHIQVATSEAVKDYLMSEEGIPEEKIRVVYNGIDPERFSPPPRARNDGLITIGYMGNLSQAKQVDVLLRAAHRIMPEFPQMRLLIIGEGLGKSHPKWEGRTDVRVKSLARELGLEHRVSFLPPLARPEDEFREMDIFVMPSVSEGMSNAILEAMATALPVCATDSGGNREVVINGVTGCLFPNRDDARLAGLLRELILDRGKRIAMGAAARERILARFTRNRMVQDMEALYAGEIARRRGRTPESP
ncbi:MAG: glycosyltransferase [Candidatus Aureabacteria bacterium]|nr:glycosyltransferase [Candidatus Auribacterota bacterium]